MLLLYGLYDSFAQILTRRVVKYSPVSNCRGGLNPVFGHIHWSFHLLPRLYFFKSLT